MMFITISILWFKKEKNCIILNTTTLVWNFLAWLAWAKYIRNN